MNEAIEIGQCWVITFGLAFVAALTDGPFGLCAAVREKVQARFSQEWIKTGIQCPVCCSCWFGLLVSSLMAASVQQFFVGWFGAIGFTCVVTSLSPD